MVEGITITSVLLSMPPVDARENELLLRVEQLPHEMQRLIRTAVFDRLRHARRQAALMIQRIYRQLSFRATVWLAPRGLALNPQWDYNPRLDALPGNFYTGARQLVSRSRLSYGPIIPPGVRYEAHTTASQPGRWGHRAHAQELRIREREARDGYHWYNE